jgi:hypothetical protein
MSTEPYAYDVFLSCASEDLVTARKLRADLGQAGVRAWLYEEENAPGVDVRESLSQAIHDSRHAVLLLSKAWVTKDTTEWEFAVISQINDPTRHVVPIARERIAASDLPFKLIRPNRTLCDWTTESCYVLLWLVLCGITAGPPGPKEDWEARGRESLARGNTTLSKSTISSEALATVNPALRIDRRVQWENVRDQMASRTSQIWLIWGDRRQAQQSFLDRVRRLLPVKPARSIFTVQWGDRIPASRPEFEEALARSIGVASDRLIDGLKGRVVDSDLFLIHEPQFDCWLSSEALLAYYTLWLPELLDQVDPNPSAIDRTGNIRAVQALGWSRPGSFRLLPTSLRFLGVSNLWTAREAESLEARRFVDKLRKQASHRLPVVLFDQLRDLTLGDIKNWTLEIRQESERQRLLKELTRPGLDTAAVFELAAKALEGKEAVRDD